jgi:hypothetical protein
VFALHPMYISLQELAQGKPPEKMVEALDKARLDSEHPVDMDYEETMRVKLDVARAIFDSAQGSMCAFPNCLVHS